MPKLSSTKAYKGQIENRKKKKIKKKKKKTLEGTEIFSRTNENISRRNEIFSRRNEDISRTNENISITGALCVIQDCWYPGCHTWLVELSNGNMIVIQEC